MRNKHNQAFDPASNPILDVLYTYDPLDNIEVREALEARYDYGYDNIDRLTIVDTTKSGEAQPTSQAWDYDPVGNRQTDSHLTDANNTPLNWIYDDNDRLMQRGAITYEYDANGSQTKQTNSDTGEIKHYTYTLENRLKDIRDQNNSLIVSYSYDPFGKRQSKTINNITIYYHYSEDGLVAEATANGSITTSYHYQMNSHWGTDPMFIKQGNQYGYYITDHLGTPQSIIGRNGAKLWQATYNSFGEVQITVNSLTNNLRFPGQYYDKETELHYNYFRYYDPKIGRYITSDPIGLEGGINTFGYVLQNPINFIDPEGLWGYSTGTDSYGSAIVGVGVVGGVNSQFFSDGSSGNFTVTGTGYGFDSGLNAGGNFAVHTGDGGVDSWDGDFTSANMSFAGYGVSLFWGGDWYGVGYVTTSDGFGFSQAYTNYQRICQ